MESCKDGLNSLFLSLDLFFPALIISPFSACIDFTVVFISLSHFPCILFLSSVDLQPHVPSFLPTSVPHCHSGLEAGGSFPTEKITAVIVFDQGNLSITYLWPSLSNQKHCGSNIWDWTFKRLSGFWVPAVRMKKFEMSMWRFWM